MRIAFSGAHRVGKSTLLEHVADLLPSYTTIDEPYHLLEEDGYEFADPPSLEDFEAQLERSLLALDDAGADVLFDRCPADILAYLLVQDDASAFDTEAWIDRVRVAMTTLDLVVLVPVSFAHDDRHRRMTVHDKLEEILLDDAFGFDVEVLRVEGDLAARVRRVIAKVNELRCTKRRRAEDAAKDR